MKTNGKILNIRSIKTIVLCTSNFFFAHKTKFFKISNINKAPKTLILLSTRTQKLLFTALLTTVTYLSVSLTAAVCCTSSKSAAFLYRLITPT